MTARRAGRVAAGVILAGVAVLLVLAGAFSYAVFFSPVGRGSEKVTVRIESGSSLREIGATLHEAGAVTHEDLFFWSARLAGLDRKLQSGDYEIHPTWSLPALLETLTSGRAMMHSVTLPEGITMEQVAGRLDAAGITDGGSFLALTRNRAFLDSLGIPGPTAEGFLFPETYLFAPSSRAEDVMAAMAAQFFDVMDELLAESPPPDLPLLDLVTLASLVEKETGLPEERALVAAVFTNRLRKGNRLESDPTVIYGIENFNGNLTRRDLRTPSPYNTYVIRGLPPGPIANPGRGALWASLNPAQADYFFFVSRNDGSHHFSNSLAEHREAVRRYQMARRRR